MASILPDFTSLVGRVRGTGADRTGPAAANDPTPPPAGHGRAATPEGALTLTLDFKLELSAEARAAAAERPAPGADPFDRIANDPEMLKLAALLKSLSEEAYAAFVRTFRRFARDVEGTAGEADLAALAGRLREGLEGVARGAERARAVFAERRIEVSVRFEFYLEDRKLAARVEGAVADPLVFDLAGDGFDLTPFEREGVRFDLDGDGRIDRTAFVGASDALLALDRNDNGRIDDGRELFGDQHGAANGFAELAKFDANGDGRIDAADPVYFRLLAWRDLNRNGASDDGELFSLADLGVASLGLDARDRNETVNGNRIARAGAYTRTDGTTGGLGEAHFRFSTVA